MRKRHNDSRNRQKAGPAEPVEEALPVAEEFPSAEVLAYAVSVVSFFEGRRVNRDEVLQVWKERALPWHGWSLYSHRARGLAPP